MSTTTLSTEARANMLINLELELDARKDKLVAMCEAQVASLRSRLERRVNRVPNNKRTTRIIDLVNAAQTNNHPAVKKEPAAPISRRANPASSQTEAHTSTRGPAPVPAATQGSSKRIASKAVTATKASTMSRAAAAPRPARGTKRTSDEISGEDKENNTETRPLPKLRMAKKAKTATVTTTSNTSSTVTVKTTATPTTSTRATRATRAASKNVNVAPHVLSPKTNNSRPATRARRAR